MRILKIKQTIIVAIALIISSCGGNNSQKNNDAETEAYKNAQEEVKNAQESLKKMLTITGTTPIAVACNEGVYGYIDTNNTRVIPFIYNSAKEFYEGRAAVKLKDKWGFIDITGKYIVEPKYQQVCDFYNGKAIVDKGTLNGGFYEIDITGKELRKASGNDYSKQYTLMSGNAYQQGVENSKKKGKRYLTLGEFYNGRAKVSIEKGRNTLYGFVNEKYEEVVPLKYYDANEYRFGLASLKLPPGGSYTDDKGNPKTIQGLWVIITPGNIMKYGENHEYTYLSIFHLPNQVFGKEVTQESGNTNSGANNNSEETTSSETVSTEVNNSSKTIVGSYFKAFSYEEEGEEPQVIFKAENGKVLYFHLNESLFKDKNFFIESDGNEKTNKTIIGKKYIIKYTPSENTSSDYLGEIESYVPQ